MEFTCVTFTHGRYTESLLCVVKFIVWQGRQTCDRSAVVGKALPAPPCSADFPRTFQIRISEPDGLLLWSCRSSSGQCREQELAQERSHRRPLRGLPSRHPNQVEFSPSQGPAPPQGLTLPRDRRNGSQPAEQEGTSET